MKASIYIPVLIFYTVVAIATTKTINNNLDDYLLPKHLKPTEYDIHIIPYFETPSDKAFTFDGNVKITFTVQNVTNMIRMHAYNMTILGENAILKKIGEDIEIPIMSFNTSNDDHHFLSYYLEEFLIENENYTIQFEYIGILNDDLDGFYRSYYNDSENGNTWLAATQFSPLGARRAFPCFDEPSWKARFTLHIAHPPGYHVLSNMPESSSTSIEDNPELADWKWSHREQTLIMSTFIVGFTVSQYSALLSNTDHRFNVWARRDVVLQGGYSNDVAPQILKYMEIFTGVNYTLNKMDQVAILQFAPTAMENWGMINYRETALLFVDGFSTSSSRQSTATVISHEVAHQWFGNLVSPAWWGYVWMKEGFARYFEYFALHNSAEKRWKLDEQFVHSEMRTVFQTDAINKSHPLNSQVSNPASIAANFDTIEYSKGGCIIRFIVLLLGEENFASGINSYLTTLQYGNAEPHDLWAALSTSLPENLIPEGHTLTSVMDTWVDQAGYPVVTLTRNYTDSSKATLTQHRFLTIPSYRDEIWSIPITWTIKGHANYRDIEVKAWLMDNEMVIDNLTAASNQWIILNVRQIGYYRVNYDLENWRLLTLELQSGPLKIHPINRAQLLDDAFALARANSLNYNFAFSLTAYLQLEIDYVPWVSTLASFRYIGDRFMYDKSSRELFQWFLRDRLGHMLDIVNGFNVSSNDTHILRLKRALVLEWMCEMADEECVNEANNIFITWRQQLMPDEKSTPCKIPQKDGLKTNTVLNPCYYIDPDLKNVVYCTGIQKGTTDDFHFLYKRMTEAANYVGERSVIFKALGCSTDSELLNWYLLESIKEGSAIPTNEARNVITAVYNNYLGVDIALDFIINNFEQASRTYGGFGSIGKVLAGLSSKLNTQEQRQKLVDFRDGSSEIIGEAMTSVEAAIVTLDEILAWHETHADVVLQYLTDLRGDNSATLAQISYFIITALQIVITTILI